MTINDQNSTSVKVRWWFCSPNARPLPFSTPYNSSIWWSDKSEGVDFGETGEHHFCDGTPPPWGLGPWGNPFAPPEPPAPMWWTCIQNTTENVPPFIEVGQTFRLDYDPVNDWWFSQDISPNRFDVSGTLVIIISYTNWGIGTRVWFNPLVIQTGRLDVVPVQLFPGVRPIGSELAWSGDEFISDAANCSPFGICNGCMNVAGLAPPQSTDFLHGIWYWYALETWTGQITWFDPHGQHFPSSAYFDLPGVFEWECPPGIHLVRVELLGAGGGGGVSDDLGTAGGGGGGAGAWRISKLFDVVPGVKYSLTVGAGGAGGTGLGTLRDGRDGTPSSWNSVLYAAGGRGGKGNLSGAAYAFGGEGGKETVWATPEFSRSGFDGLVSATARGGDGGHSHYADGGAAGELGPGDPGQLGSGGGGGGTSGAAGGKGGNGYVVLIWGFEQPRGR